MKVFSMILLLFPSAVLSVKAKILLVSHDYDILQLDLRNFTRSRVVGADMPVVDFDVHEAWKHVYWATDNHIYRTPLYDLDAYSLIAVAGRVGSLAVDWVHNHIYWTDLTAARIEAAHLNGRGRRVVHVSDGSVTTIALDPEAGKLFWIETFLSGLKMIRSSNLDGSQVRSVYISEDIYEDSPLAVDVLYKSIYFYKINGNYSEQWEINYQGIEPQIKLFGKEEPPPRTMALDKEGFFYSNKEGVISGTWVKRRYTLVYGNTTSDIVVLDPYFKLEAKYLGSVSQIRVLGETAQPPWQDDCSRYLCQQDCVPVSLGHLTARGTRCVCHYGYSLAADNTTCDERGYVLYNTDTAFGRLTLDGGHLTLLYNDSSKNILDFDIHIRSGSLYWSDSIDQAIYKAPVELPVRHHVIVTNVSVYGMAVDWIHDHIYWSESNRILVSDLEGSRKVVLLKDLDSPAKMAVDPVNKCLFWAECGRSLSLKTAGLDGSDVTRLVDDVACGAGLSADHASRVLFWLDWEGAVYSCNYDGSEVTRIPDRSAQAMTLLGGNILFVPLEQGDTASVNNTHAVSQFYTLGIKPTALKVVKSSEQPLAYNPCEETDCPGLCIPQRDVTVPLCICPRADNEPVPCNELDNHSNEGDLQVPGRKGYFELVRSTPFSVTLRCVGGLLTHPVMRPFLQVTEVDSLVPRGDDLKQQRVVRVDNKTLPFTIDNLNPAMSYQVSVMNRVTRASFSWTVHTPPPPLAIERLPLVTVPGIEGPIPWREQGVHFTAPNAWQHITHREFILLLVSKNEYSQSYSYDIPQAVLVKIKDHFSEAKENFMILHHYKSEEEFDDDPTMYLANIPWGGEFRLAMVQVTDYKAAYNLDFVFSEQFSLPDPYWKVLLEKILDDQE